MKNEYAAVSELWGQEYSSQLTQKINYRIPEHFQRLASIFSPGRSFYYIMNLMDLHLEFISPEVEQITGIPHGEVEIQDLLNLVLEEDIQSLLKKEMVLKDFYKGHVRPEEILNYKVIYTYRMQNRSGNRSTMLHQVMVLSVSDQGKPQHVIGIHTDISHLNPPVSNSVSFIGLEAGITSYYKVPVDQAKFIAHQDEETQQCLSELLSARELEILSLLARGHSAAQIGKMLHLSFNTVRTHRKNMLNKTACGNTTELVAQAFMEGVFPAPGF